MWCARLPLSRPDSTVVVCAGGNWAAFGPPFFYLRRIPCIQRFSNIEMLKYFCERNIAFTLTSQ